MWDTIASLAVIPALLALFAAVLRRSLSRSKAMVARWAKDNGVRLSRCVWRFGGGELLLSLRAVDREGRVRDGRVR